MTLFCGACCTANSLHELVVDCEGLMPVLDVCACGALREEVRSFGQKGDLRESLPDLSHR